MRKRGARTTELIGVSCLGRSEKPASRRAVVRKDPSGDAPGSPGAPGFWLEYPHFMAMYLCRWPNGDFSIFSASTKGDAIEMLDEWGNAEQAALTRMADCMFDLRLRDDGEVELAAISEATEEYVMQTCYPELQKALAIAEEDDGEDPQRTTKESEKLLNGRGRGSGAISRAKTSRHPARPRHSKTARRPRAW